MGQAPHIRDVCEFHLSVGPYVRIYIFYKCSNNLRSTFNIFALVVGYHMHAAVVGKQVRPEDICMKTFFASKVIDHARYVRSRQGVCNEA